MFKNKTIYVAKPFNSINMLTTLANLPSHCLKDLKTKHAKALAEGKNSFWFKDEELLTRYAGYLIQAIENQN